MSTQALVQIDPQQQLVAGGVGLGGRLFQLKPATIEVVQKMTRQEGAIPGKLRITATNEHFSEMHVVMLFEPVEQRAYFEGEDFSASSKICFSLDNLQPHAKAQVPQAMNCGMYNSKGFYVAQCPRADWTKYRQTKLKADMPKCRGYWHVILADRVTQLPYYLNIKGASIAGFQQAMQNVARMIGLMQARGEKPNIFDISFKIFVKQENGAPNYILGFKEIAPLKPEDRAAFGAIFVDFFNRRNQGLVQDQVASEAGEVAKETAAVEAAVTEAPAAAPAVVLPTGPKVTDKGIPIMGVSPKEAVITI